MALVAPEARRELRLQRWLRRAVWCLAKLYVAALLGHHPARAPTTSAHPPWTGVEPYFIAPFILDARMKRTATDAQA
ncbi:unnamed protein product [Urochloa humidicola]